MKMYYFCSKTAKELALWARDEPNRIKASKIFRVAERVEARARRFWGKDMVPPPPPTDCIFL